MHAYSPLDNISLIEAVVASEHPVGDVCFLKTGDSWNIVTMDSECQIQVFSISEGKVIETLTPEGQPTCIRVFDQFPEILFIGYSKQAPNGSIVGNLLAFAGAHRLEVEAHDNTITDIICVSVNDPNFTGEVFFTSSLDCKLNLDNFDCSHI